MSDNYSARKGKTFFGHPIQLSTLFHIELWERFSFYGMQGILLIYLYYTADKGGLGMDKSLAGGIDRLVCVTTHRSTGAEDFF